MRAASVWLSSVSLLALAATLTLHFYEPALDPKVERWINEAPRPPYDPRALALTESLKWASIHEETGTPCISEHEFFGRARLAVSFLGTRKIDPEIRTHYRKALTSLPFHATKLEHFYDWTSISRGQLLDFYRDLWELGTLQKDTILVNLETSKRLVLESTTIEDFVLSHLLYYRALTATNLALATSAQADSRAIQGALLPFSFSDKDMEQLLQGEIGYRQAILSAKESSFFEKES